MAKIRNIVIFMICISFFIGGRECCVEAEAKTKEMAELVHTVVIRNRKFDDCFVLMNGDIVVMMHDKELDTEVVCYEKSGKFKWRVCLERESYIYWICELNDKILLFDDENDIFYLIENEKVIVIDAVEVFPEGVIHRLFYDEEKGYIVLKGPRKSAWWESSDVKRELIYFDKEGNEIGRKTISQEGDLVSVQDEAEPVEVRYIDKRGDYFYISSEYWSYDGHQYYLMTDWDGNIIKKQKDINSRDWYSEATLDADKVQEVVWRKGYEEIVDMFLYKNKVVVVAAHHGFASKPVRQGVFVFNQKGKLKSFSEYPVREYLSENTVEKLGEEHFVSISGGQALVYSGRRENYIVLHFLMIKEN